MILNAAPPPARPTVTTSSAWAFPAAKKARSGDRALCRADPSTAYKLLEPMLVAIAAKSEFGACVTHVGPGASGHYVKMVHNGIEYGDMQLIAETYDIMRRALGLGAGQIASVFDGWNQGKLSSFLIEDHRAGACLHRFRNRQTAGRYSARHRGAERNRALDQSERARSGHADSRDRRRGARAFDLFNEGTPRRRQSGPRRRRAG